VWLTSFLVLSNSLIDKVEVSNLTIRYIRSWFGAIHKRIMAKFS
jgi:hypothetical protein